mgnify:CR=1 FL=1
MITTDSLDQALAPHRAKLLEHPLYTKLTSLEAIQVFMTYHAFAVWDFMSLVKSLQQKLNNKVTNPVLNTILISGLRRTDVTDFYLRNSDDIDDIFERIKIFILYLDIGT